MPPTSTKCGTVRSDEARRANALIHALFARARAEVRGLTDDERAEYERLRAVYVEAVAAA